MPHFDRWFVISACEMQNLGDIVKQVDVMRVLADYRGPSGGVLPGLRKEKGEIAKGLQKLFRSKGSSFLLTFLGHMYRKKNPHLQTVILLSSFRERTFMHFFGS